MNIIIWIVIGVILTLLVVAEYILVTCTIVFQGKTYIIPFADRKRSVVILDGASYRRKKGKLYFDANFSSDEATWASEVKKINIFDVLINLFMKIFTVEIIRVLYASYILAVVLFGVHNEEVLSKFFNIFLSFILIVIGISILKIIFQQKEKKKDIYLFFS